MPAVQPNMPAVQPDLARFAAKMPVVPQFTEPDVSVVLTSGIPPEGLARPVSEDRSHGHQETETIVRPPTPLSARAPLRLTVIDGGINVLQSQR
jgi:hypothetical protein